MYSLNCNRELIDLKTPKIMGILNITPDSFYDGGKLKSDKDIINKTATMLAAGATFIDIGGYSSRPDSTDISIATESARVVPVIKILIKEFPQIIISCDTFRSEVARQAINHGAQIINDISAGNLDDKMLETVAQFQVPYIMMHMRGTPQTMKTLNKYDDITHEVIKYFSERIAAARAAGINDVVVDPGFGFAKGRSPSYELLDKSYLLQHLEVPILHGISRKSMIYKTLDITAADALNGTSALHMVSLLNGANILRVHDVKEAVEVVTLYNALKGK